MDLICIFNIRTYNINRILNKQSQKRKKRLVIKTLIKKK